MTGIPDTSTERGFVVFLTARGDAGAAAATSTPSCFSVVCWPSLPAREYEQHATALPTLDDVLAKLRMQHPTFDASLASASREAEEHLLALVAAGTMTRLQAERLRLGMTQGELAREAEMAQPNVSRLEQVGASMRVQTARRLARALKLGDYKVLLP